MNIENTEELESLIRSHVDVVLQEEIIPIMELTLRNNIQSWIYSYPNEFPRRYSLLKFVESWIDDNTAYTTSTSAPRPSWARMPVHGGRGEENFLDMLANVGPLWAGRIDRDAFTPAQEYLDQQERILSDIFNSAMDKWLNG